ncbi:MAG: serine/threonine-protein kinase [Pseudomonadota bacterium]
MKKYRCPFCDRTHPISIAECPEVNERVPVNYRMEGRVLEGKYEIGAPIGAGGMGVVYRAVHKRLGRQLAVKFIHARYLAKNILLSRFQNEARLAASIGHKNIVDILDLGSTHDGMFYIVMEYLKGNPLGEVVHAAGRLPDRIAVGITIQILEALNAVHSKGVIHRDIKPDNIFIVEQAGGGQLVKILDFGISRLYQPDEKKKSVFTTQPGTVLGTPNYMSPEQALGGAEVDYRSDLYSVGVILYYMVTGRLPYESANINELIADLSTKEAVAPSVLVPDMSPELEKAILRAIAKDREKRFVSAAAFAARLLPLRAVDDDEDSVVVEAVPSHIFSAIRQPHNLVRVKPPTPEGQTRPPMNRAAQENATISYPPGFKPEKETGKKSFDSSGAGNGDTDSIETGVTTQPQRKAEHNKFKKAATPVAAEFTAARQAKKAVEWKRVAMSLMAGIILMMGFFGYFAYRTLRLEQSIKSLAAFQEYKAMPLSTKTAAAAAWQVIVDGIPEKADLYVDEVLHTERPITVKDSPEPRKIKIEAPGFETWEKSVIIRSDTTLHITNLNKM